MASPQSAQIGLIVMSLLVAIVMIASAYFGKDTVYENVWLYILPFWFLGLGAFDVHMRRKNKKQ